MSYTGIYCVVLIYQTGEVDTYVLYTTSKFNRSTRWTIDFSGEKTLVQTSIIWFVHGNSVSNSLKVDKMLP